MTPDRDEEILALRHCVDELDREIERLRGLLGRTLTWLGAPIGTAEPIADLKGDITDALKE